MWLKVRKYLTKDVNEVVEVLFFYIPILGIVCIAGHLMLNRHHFIVDTNLWITSNSYSLDQVATIGDNFQGVVPLKMPIILKCIDCDEIAKVYKGKVTRLYKKLKDVKMPRVQIGTVEA